MARYCDEECQANDFSHHAKSCHVLARRWDGVGIAPMSLIPLISDGSWKDPAILPSARARERMNKGVLAALTASGKVDSSLCLEELLK